MTTLDPQFLSAALLLHAYKGGQMRAAQAGLIYLGLRSVDFTAADLPAEITNGSKHIAGAATGALVAIGLLTVVGRCKSPDPAAKGRKLDVLRLTNDRRQTALAWLRNNGLPTAEETQAELFGDCAA